MGPAPARTTPSPNDAASHHPALPWCASGGRSCALVPRHDPAALRPEWQGGGFESGAVTVTPSHLRALPWRWWGVRGKSRPIPVCRSCGAGCRAASAGAHLSVPYMVWFAFDCTCISPNLASWPMRRGGPLWPVWGGGPRLKRGERTPQPVSRNRRDADRRLFVTTGLVRNAGHRRGGALGRQTLSHPLRMVRHMHRGRHRLNPLQRQNGSTT